MSERFEPLAAQRTAIRRDEDPVGLLDLVSLPAFELVRPRDWSAVDDVVGRLGALAGAA